MYYVYGHYQHDTGNVFYVGKGSGSRLYEETVGRNKYWTNVARKHEWYVDIIDEFETAEEALQCEKDVIAFFGRRDLGTGPLVNMTTGGDGVLSLSVESRQKMSLFRLGNTNSLRRKLSPKMYLKISTSNTGKNYTPEVRERLLKANLGKSRSEETKHKISLAQKGIPRKPHTAESKAKLSSVLTGKPHKGHNARRIGIKHSEETKAKMRVTWALKRQNLTGH